MRLREAIYSSVFSRKVPSGTLITDVKLMQQQYNKATISLYIGPMFSGKTDRMLRELRTHARVSSALVILFKYSKDDREEGSIVLSRSGASSKATAMISTGREAWSNVKDSIAGSYMKSIVVIGIDEGQFIDGID